MIARRRNRLRAALRDLAAAAAFGSMATSGLLPIWAQLTFGIALLLALFDLRPLSRRGTLTAILLALIALGLWAMVAAGSLDLVLAACTFAGFISAQRMLAAPTVAIDSQVHLTSLLMVAGGAALSGDLLFGLFLGVFAVLTTLSLGLGVIEGALPEGADFPVRPIVTRLVAASMAALIGSAVFFVVFPRMSWRITSRNIAPGNRATTGMAENINLGAGTGSIKSNPRVVFRAELDPDPGVDQLRGYWRGRSYARFNGTEWLAEGLPLPGDQVVSLGRRTLKSLHQRIELLPAFDAQTAVALETPVMIANATAHWPGGSMRTALVHYPGEEVRFSDKALSYTYHAYSAGDPAASEERDAPLEPYLELPPDLDPRVAELARSLAGSETDPLVVAERIQRHLQTGYRYSLELHDDPDPLAAFLFERKAGHCEHFATALTVMLRAVGIPARVAGGFYGGERVGDRYVVRAGDAHAWSQVLLRGQGFITIDATPPEGRATQPSTLVAWLVARYEALEELWRAQVLDYTFLDQARAVRKFVRSQRGTAQRGEPAPARGRWIGAGLAALLAYAAWRIPWRKLKPKKGPVEATRLLEAIEAVLGRYHLAPRPGLDLEEHAANLSARGHPAAPAVQRITRRYLEARFGERPLGDGERGYWLKTLARDLDALESARRHAA